MNQTEDARVSAGYLGDDRARLLRRAAEMPRRFPAAFPIELIVDMDYIAPDRAFSRDLSEYHRKLYQRDEGLYVGDNLARNLSRGGLFTGRGTVTVDESWISRFPQYAPYAGDALALYPIGGGAQAVCVPRSLYPRLGLLPALEAALGVTKTAREYAGYAISRLIAGEKYDSQRFMREYAQSLGQRRAPLRQADIDRAFSLSPGGDDPSRSALRAALGRQAQPYRYSADLMVWQTVSKPTARLCQPIDTESGFISDLWTPYADAQGCMDMETGECDARALCQLCQIAPDPAPDGLSGRYPDALLVVTVADRRMKLLAGEAVNNPAYGDGIGAEGALGRQILLPESARLLEQGKLREDKRVPMVNREVSPEEYANMEQCAMAQAKRCELIDAVMDYEDALKRFAASGKAKDRDDMNARKKRVEDMEAALSARGAARRLSGDLADEEYLFRRLRARESMEAFAADDKREKSVAFGRETRGSVVRARYPDQAQAKKPAQMSMFELAAKQKREDETV